jgi:antitoxin component YwqK of YwqJK toxin-antitoxin module
LTTPSGFACHPSKDGIANGLYKGYYESGKLKEKTYFKDGNVEWLGKIYLLNGAVVEAQYKNNIATSGVSVQTGGEPRLLTRN